MDGYDITNEAVIGADTATVWDALVAEFAGAGRWWTPSNTFEPLNGPPDRVGADVRVTVHVKGHDRGGPKLRFVARTREVEPERRFAVDYVDGVFRGTGEFRLRPTEDGRTRLAMDFRARAHGWLRLLARVVDVGAQHAAATTEAFGRLDAESRGHATPERNPA